MPSTNTNLKSSVHIFLASKGGVGKTTLAALTSEWFLNCGESPALFDADAKNTDACLSRFDQLNATRLSDLLITKADGSEKISETGFEKLLDSLLTEDGPHLIDTGANTYTQWMAYVSEMSLGEELEAAGKQVFVHVIAAGGEMLEESVANMREIASKSPSQWKLVVWMNEFKSPAKMRTGEHFTQSSALKEIAPRVAGLISMPEVSPVQRDALDQLGSLHLTSAEVKADGAISAQKRIAFGSWARKAFQGLDQVFGIGK
jgi:hypothetical protein